MSHICLPLGVNRDDLEHLENLVKTSAVKQHNDKIFRQGDPFSRVFAVKSGTLKSSRVDEQGNEHVIAFHLPGELIGLDGIYPEHYSSTVTALDTSVLCEMDYEKLSELCITIPALQRQLLRLLSRDIYESHVSQSENADQTAIQRVAGFLHNLSTRFEFRGFSPTEFRLAMTRQDIASHLGLTPETVSRVLKRFKQDEIVAIENRQLNIVDTAALNDIVHCRAA
jgi:CRP/FNR family transcriptional regulator